MEFLKGGWLRKEATTYKGLLNCGAPGLQEAVIAAAQSFVPHRDRVLDLGAGNGALLMRMADNGYRDLHAADLGGEGLKQRGISHTRADFDGDFASAFGEVFKLIISTEVIEHVESPRRFLRQLRQLLDDDGYLILSTPNIAFWEGRLKFLLTGQLWGFGERQYRAIRHISPFSLDQLKLMLAEIGLEILSVQTVGSFATVARWCLFSPIWVPMRVLFGALTLGETILVVTRRGEPDLELATPSIYRDVWREAERS